MAKKISVVFITKNEEFHIGDAIANVKDFAQDIFVVDSGSADRTVEIAKAVGAVVLYHPFEGFGAQWNWALNNCPIKTEWTMKMDPDERLSDPLKTEIAAAVDNADDVVGFSFDRVLWFMGKRLNGVRNEVLRLWKTGTCQFSDVQVNEHPIVNGKCRKLRHYMEHLDSQNLSHWLLKQNDYSTREAIIRYTGAAMAAAPRLLGSKLERRMWLKKHLNQVPFRFALLNIANFIFTGAWRSGIDGWRWVKCREMVMRLREYKFQEMVNHKECGK